MFTLQLCKQHLVISYAKRVSCLKGFPVNDYKKIYVLLSVFNNRSESKVIIYLESDAVLVMYIVISSAFVPLVRSRHK